MINNNGTYKRADILGFPVNKMTLDDCVNILESFIPARKPRQLVLVNAAKIVKARFDKELRNIIFTADLVGADGLPIVWASKILSDPLPGRVNGTDLMERLVELAARKKYRLYLLGATQEIIEKTAADFQSQYPELILVGCRNGYFKDASEEQLTVQELSFLL